MLDAPASTYLGDIYVESPAVYTRERILNDRSNQAAWIEAELKALDSRTFGIQGSAQRSDFSALLASGTITIERAQQIQQFLTQQPGSQPSTPAELKAIFDQLTTKELTPTIPSPIGTPSSSPIDLFRDRLAYREEVRTELIQTNLDDRHDLRGNTLYRFTFDTTVRPASDDIDAWAVVRAQFRPPEDEDADYDVLYEEWRRYLVRVLEKIRWFIIATLKSPQPDDDYVYAWLAYLGCEINTFGEVDPLEEKCSASSISKSSRLDLPMSPGIPASSRAKSPNNAIARKVVFSSGDIKPIRPMEGYARPEPEKKAETKPSDATRQVVPSKPLDSEKENNPALTAV